MVEGWTVLIHGSTAILGALVFLRLVACELERVAQMLRRRELLASRERARQTGRASADTDIIESEVIRRTNGMEAD